MFDADVAVVGLGAWGSCALWTLARRGVRAVGIERFTPGHSMGSSGGTSRMFRTACLEHPGLVPLARRSLELWHELQSSAGQPLIDSSGGLLIGPRDGHIIDGTLAASRVHDLPVQVWDSGELRNRMPVHAGLPDHHIGVWEQGAGLIRPERAIAAAVQLAEAAGARVFTDTKVTGIELVADGAVVSTPVRDLRVRQVVVTAGGWLGSLVDELPVETVRMPMTWFEPMADRERFALERLPVFMRQLDDGVCVWGHGILPWNNAHTGLVKLGLEDSDGRFPVIDPEAFDRSVSPEDWDLLVERLRTAVPGVREVPARVSVCMYTRTPDNQFLLGRPRRDPRLVIAGGCNNHGFKHATGVGEAVADLVMGRPPSYDLAFCDPDRFG
ncbi:N-methyl-L-tryptophan oxidase [Saccharopolyspora pogona]|uniref:N-methyl-L-tryptophan oxidase n=1 Tax=Saccharopolyspora pogona TaxID=333966 RepID=UPI0016833BFE|nr:N-methyl-L-tryptophan oxidase [Saccharopolyspora pogona]